MKKFTNKLNEAKNDFSASYNKIYITIKNGNVDADAAEKLYYDIGKLVEKSKLSIEDVVIKVKK